MTDTNKKAKNNEEGEEVGAVCVPIIAIMFPLKLHRILDDAAEKEYEDIISWVPANNGFKVHKPLEFDSKIMPQYFNKTKYKSFQRQLNIWGFERVNHGNDKGAYLHTLFVRGKPKLCNGMKRTKIKGIHSKTLLRNKSKNTTTSNSNKINCVNMTVTTSWQVAARKVADLERQREEIQKQLNTASKQMMIPRSLSVNNNELIDELIDLLPTDLNSNSNSNSNSQQGQEQGQGQRQITGRSNKAVRCPSLTLEEGDNTIFEGRNFFFVEEGRVLELGCNDSDIKRSTSRRLSLTLKQLDSDCDCDCDEYVMKELEEAIQLGTGIFGAMNTNTHTNTNTNTKNTNINTTNQPGRQFSFQSTPVQNPFEKPLPSQSPSPPHDTFEANLHKYQF